MRKSPLLRQCLAAFLSALGMMLVIYALLGVAPFGTNGILLGDANAQYVDFLAYFQDVLRGENSLSYTFSKLLGDSGVTLYGYYLASPFNLLVAVVPKAYLDVFFHLLAAFKLALAAGAMAFFLNRRFDGRLDDLMTVLLALGYGLGQFAMVQKRNIMWLDGFYLLPLLLWGVYEAVAHRRVLPLGIVSALTILFNWYTGGINCLFSIGWFGYEAILLEINTRDSLRGHCKRLLGALMRYGLSMLSGLLLSCCLFYPTILGLQKGRGELDLDLFRNMFLYPPLETLQGLSIGGGGLYQLASLFCGSLALLGVICFFGNRRISLPSRLFTGLMVLAVGMTFTWQPLFLLFSLLKRADSHWCRYAYTGIFTLVFVAGYFYSTWERDKRWSRYLPLAAVGFSGVFLALRWFSPKQRLLLDLLTVVFLLLTAELMALHCRKSLRLLPLGLVGCVLLELGINGVVVSGYSLTSARNYNRDYISAQARQIQALTDYDSGLYRVSQTATREEDGTGVTASYNEALVYGYRSTTGYSSAADNNQLTMMDHLGYASWGACFNAVRTSIIGADSLLGVKYVLSKAPIRGLTLVEELPDCQGKQVYENPYALPLALRYNPGALAQDKSEDNPFLYQNQLYSQLLGREVTLYQPVAWESQDTQAGRVYTLTLPHWDCALYGNLPWDSYGTSQLTAGDAESIRYGAWNTPSVFYIPSQPGDATAQVTLSQGEGFHLTDTQFYALDLALLAQVTAELTARPVEALSMEGGSVSCRVSEGSEGEMLLLSVPYDRGFQVLRNGEAVTPELFAGCLMAIPLTQGSNEISLTYHIPGLAAGFAMSLGGLLLLLAHWAAVGWLRRRVKAQ